MFHQCYQGAPWLCFKIDPCFLQAYAQLNQIRKWAYRKIGLNITVEGDVSILIPGTPSQPRTTRIPAKTTIMKLVVAGATGFLGTEVVRQALSHPKITSVIALARRQTAVPEGSGSQADASKLKPVACDDFINYPESVKTEISDADACIWCVWPLESHGTLKLTVA